jgi:hypothetical protein
MAARRQYIIERHQVTRSPVDNRMSERTASANAPERELINRTNVEFERGHSAPFS